MDAPSPRLHKKRRFPASGWVPGKLGSVGGRCGCPQPLDTASWLHLAKEKARRCCLAKCVMVPEETEPEAWKTPSRFGVACPSAVTSQRYGGNKMATNSEPRSLPLKINRDVGVVIPLGFSLRPPAMAGRDGLTLLPLSCPAHPARQETGSFLPPHRAACGCCDSCTPRLAISPLRMGHKDGATSFVTRCR